MNELQKVKQFHVWESTYDLYDWTDIVPEVTDSRIKSVVGGLLTDKKTDIPKPKCKTFGYSAWEWLMHWKKVLSNTVLPVTAKEQMEDYRRMMSAR